MDRYKEIFYEIINNYKYDYSLLYEEDITSEVESIYKNKLNELHFKLLKLTNEPLDNFNPNNLLLKLEEFKLSTDKEKYIKLKNIYLNIINIKNKIKKFKESKDDNYKYGVCQDFAIAFINKCIDNGLDAYYCKGAKLYKGNIVNHMWNYIIVDGKILHIDISSAIHAIDNKEKDNKAIDFFCITLDDLKKLDKENKRFLSVESKISMETNKKNSIEQEKNIIIHN